MFTHTLNGLFVYSPFSQTWPHHGHSIFYMWQELASYDCEKTMNAFLKFPLLSLTMYDVFDSLIISLIFSLNWFSSIYLHITWRAWEFYLYHLDSNSEHSWQQKPCFDWPTFMQILWENGHRQGLTKLRAQVAKETKKKKK